jgi:hypothetical protein
VPFIGIVHADKIVLIKAARSIAAALPVIFEEKKNIGIEV